MTPMIRKARKERLTISEIIPPMVKDPLMNLGGHVEAVDDPGTERKMLKQLDPKLVGPDYLRARRSVWVSRFTG